MKILKALLCAVFILLSFQENAQVSGYEYVPLRPGEKMKHNFEGSNPVIYCTEGKEKDLVRVWETHWLEIGIESDQFDLYEGQTTEEVMELYRNNTSWWSLNLLSWKWKRISLNPFNVTCVGVVTKQDYTISLNVLHVDFWRLSLFTIGIFVFYYARHLSHNQLFYYLCGIAAGIFASILIATFFIIYKIIPNKPVMWGVMMTGWTISVYFANLLIANLKWVLIRYRDYVMSYIATAGLISFIFCYRFGYDPHPRTRNIIYGTLQVIGLAMVFYSSYLREVTMTIDIIMILLRIIPAAFVNSAGKIVKGAFYRPKRKLLTDEEYRLQGLEETRKALEELKTFCSSPESKPWKLVPRLKDPTRFADFVNGSFHVSDLEVTEYEQESFSASGDYDTEPEDDNNDH